MSNRKYRLLKDLPGRKAGAVYTPENRNPEWYNTNGGLFYQRIPIEQITDNPEWFEEIKEPEAPAQTTEDLVLYDWFGRVCRYSGYELVTIGKRIEVRRDKLTMIVEIGSKDEEAESAISSLLRHLIEPVLSECYKRAKDFIIKQDAKKEPEAPARIEVGAICKTETNDYDPSDRLPHKYRIFTSQRIPASKLNALPRAIEAVVNGDGEWIVTTDGTNDEYPKIYVSGTEYAPKGFWTDKLVREYVNYAMKVSDTIEDIRKNYISDFKKSKSGEQSKQPGAGRSSTSVDDQLTTSND